MASHPHIDLVWFSFMVLVLKMLKIMLQYFLELKNMNHNMLSHYVNNFPQQHKAMKTVIFINIYTAVKIS